MTGRFRFFVQTTCGNSKTGFTVDITEKSKPEPVTEDREPPSTESNPKARDDKSPTGSGSQISVIAVAVGCFILIIIIMTIIYKKKLIYSKPCGFLRRIFQGHRHNEDNSNFQEQNPENVI